jgi:hypothetical protein
MELQPSTAPLPPFFAAVRRRHEDVDIVLLPPEVPVEAAEPVTDTEVEAAHARVGAILERAWTDATEQAGEPETRVGYGPEQGTVVAKARIMARVSDGERVVEALFSVLTEDGWRLGRPGGGGVPRFLGRRDDLTVRVSYAEASGGVVVDLSTDPMPVGMDRARDLVRQ